MSKTGAPLKKQPLTEFVPKRKPDELPPLKRVPGMGKHVVYDTYSGRYVVFRRTS